METDNLDIITTEWNGYKFKFVEKSDYPAILTQLNENFFRDEPMHNILGITPERVADINRRITDILNLEHGSFYASPINQPEKIAAVLIIWIQEIGFQLPKFENRSPDSGVIRKSVVQLKEKYDIHEQHGVDIYPELFIISTDREHRGKGLATEMYRRAIAKLKSQGHKLVSSTFTNPHSRKIGEKLGFKQVSRVNFNDVKNDDGSLAYGLAGDGHCLVETVLEL